MPYASNSDLPATVRGIVPDEHAQAIFRNAFNAQLAAGKSEARAFAGSYAALENAGYHRNGDGKYVKKTGPAVGEVHVNRPLGSDREDTLAKRISGNSPISLNTKGRALAKKLGERLALKGSLDVLHNSPLPRAKETADAIAEQATEMKRAPAADALRPWRLGEIEGKQSSDVSNLIAHYIEHPNEVPPGNGNDGKPAESFNDAKKRQLDYLAAVKQDADEHPNLKIGVVMHSRGMELLQSWVDVGEPDDYALDEKDLLKPDDPEHASVLRWHGDKVKDVDLEDDDELKPGVYLILHSLTDDDTDEGDPELEKRYTPPLEVHKAAVRAEAAGQTDEITRALADSRGITLYELRSVPMLLPQCPKAQEWAERVLRKADEGEHWVTINGSPVLIGADGEPKSGNPKVLAALREQRGSKGTAAEFKPSDRMQRAMKAYVAANAAEQRAADEQEAKVSRALGIPRTADNSAFDLRNDKIGIELKTMLKSKNGKITMNKAALARKMAEAKSAKLKVFTVVADKRGGQASYYISKGVGSFRVSSMTPTTLAEIRGMVR